MSGVTRKCPDSENPESDPKRHKMSSLCVTCGRSTVNATRIACIKCFGWTHAKQACSGLTSVEAKREAVVNEFLCSKCTEAGQSDVAIDSVDDEDIINDSSGLKAILTSIVKELSECKDQLKSLIKDNASLRCENSEIKNLLKSLNKSHSFAPITKRQNNKSGGTLQPSSQNKGEQQQPPSVRGRRHGRGNSSARKGSIRSSSRGRSLSQQRDPKRRKIPLSKTDDSRPPRTSRKQAKHVRIMGSTYNSEESKTALTTALPINRVKYHMKTVFVTLYNSAASAKHVYDRLKSKHEVSRVIRLKSRSKHDNYRCFSFQCCDLDYDALFEDEDLFHPGTLIGEMDDEPTTEQVFEIYPPIGT